MNTSPQYQRFVKARTEMNQALVWWLQTNPPHEDVTTEIARTNSVMQQFVVTITGRGRAA